MSSPTRRLAFLAEAPTGEEEDAGRALSLPAPLCLVGPSGRLFANMLRAAGLTRADDPPKDWGREYDLVGLRRHMWERSDHWVGNVWPVRLEEDDFGKLFAPAGEAKAGDYADPDYYARGYGWLRPEYRPDLARLGRELAGYRPDAIVTLGAAATWTLTGESAVRECSGTRMVATRVLPGVSVYPTFHPVHVIQEFRLFDRVVEDITRAAEGVEAKPRNLWLAPDLSDMRLWWDTIGRRSEMLAVDIETTHGQIECVGFAGRGPTSSGAICVPFVAWDRPNRSYWAHAGAELDAWGIIGEWLASPIPKLMQNGTYDVFWLWHVYGLAVRNYRHDTRLMAHVYDPEMPKSLAYLGATYAVPPGPWKLMRHGEEKRDA